MVTTVLLIFILLITLFLSIFRVYSISILLGAILIFIIGSFILIQQNHLLIASIFLIVYSGAILVFICISLLISPAIRPQNNQESINKSDLISKNFRFFFLFLCISFFIAFCGFYMISCVYPETNLVEFKLNLFHKNKL